MKRTFAALCVVLMLAAMLTMAVSAKSSDDLLATIQQRGKIIIGLEGDWAPWSFVGEDDELTGYDVEVAKAIAEKLGVEALSPASGTACLPVWTPGGMISW